MQSYWKYPRSEEVILQSLKARGFKIYDCGTHYQILISPEKDLSSKIGLDLLIYADEIKTLGTITKINSSPFEVNIAKKIAKPKKVNKDFKCSNKKCKAVIKPNKNGPWIGECPYCGSLGELFA